MTRGAPRVLYVLLFLWIAISMGYYKGRPFTGSFQLINYLRHEQPGDVAYVSVRRSNGEVKSAMIRLGTWPGPTSATGEV